MASEVGPKMERSKTVEYRPVPTHQSKRILPDGTPPAEAWTENEELIFFERDSGTATPEEYRRLLKPSRPHATSKPKTPLEAGLTLGVLGIPKKHPKCHPVPKFEKAKVKTKFQKRKEKLIDLLKPPYFILSMVAIIVCVHVWGRPGGRVEAALQWAPGPWWRQPWRLVGYSLVHASAPHLALNAVVALAVGWAVEREQGWWRALAVWLGGAAGGALGAGALQPRVRVVGASAAVYALLTAHLPNVAYRFGHIPLWWFRPLSVVVLVLSELSWSLLQPADGPGAPSQPGHVAWAAHAAGAAVGVPAAFLVFTGENASKRYMVGCRVASAAVLVGGAAAAALHYALWYELD